MPLTGEALNEQGNAITRGTKPTNEAKWVTIASTEKEVVPEATAGPARKIKKTAHGLVTKDVVVFTEINAKTTFGEAVVGLIIGVPYYVHEVNANEFAVALTKAQAESATEGEWVEFSGEVKATSKVAKIVEHTGAKTKRKELTFAAAANLTNEASGAVEVEASGAVTVKWVLFYSAETVGTLMGVETTAEKVLALGDLFKITNTKISQNAYVV